MSVTAHSVVASLLEDDDVNIDHYMAKVNTGTVDEVLAALGFHKDAKYRWHLIVPIRHNVFPLAFGESDPHICKHVIIYVGPCSKRDNTNYHTDDMQSVEYQLQVSYVPEGLALSSSRDCVDTSVFSQDGRTSGRGNLAARLNHVIPFLIEAIHAADAMQHRDIYKFFNDIDKRWGRQPNRLIRRKKKI